MNKNVINLNTLVCNFIPESTLQVTLTKCSNDKGLLYEVGVMIEKGFYRIFEICYNKNTETTLYTHNTLHGAVIKCKLGLEDLYLEY